MSERAVCDTGPLLHCSEIGHAATLMALFDRLVSTAPVQAELLRLAPPRLCSQADLLVAAVQWLPTPTDLPTDEPDLHATDLAVLAMARAAQPDGARLLTDDDALRQAAVKYGIPVTGTLGCLLRAYYQGLLDKPALSTAAEAVMRDSTLWLNNDLRRWFIRQVESLA